MEESGFNSNVKSNLGFSFLYTLEIPVVGGFKGD